MTDEKDEAFKQKPEDAAEEAEASRLDVEVDGDKVTIGTRNPGKAWEKGATRDWEPPVPEKDQPKSHGVV